MAAIDYMKEALIASNAARVEAIEKGEQVLVGVNAYTETEPSPLSASGIEGIQTVPESVEIGQVAALQAWRQQRDEKGVRQALVDLKAAAAEGRNIMPPSIEAAKAGVTTGEWGQVLREVFGEYRAPTGINAKHQVDKARLEDVRRHGRARSPAGSAARSPSWSASRDSTAIPTAPSRSPCGRTDVGMDVVYDGIRLTPAEIVEQAKQAKAHVVGLSILSGSHVSLVREVVQRLREAGLGEVPVVVGGIIPPTTSTSSSNAAPPPSIRRRTSSSTTSWPASCSWSTPRPMPWSSRACRCRRCARARKCRCNKLLMAAPTDGRQRRLCR